MKVSDLGITAINEAPPPLDLTPEEVAALAEELGARPCGFCGVVLPY